MIGKYLEQGDVKLGDTVTFHVEGVGWVTGRVREMAGDGGVVGIVYGGTWYSAGLRSVVKLENNQ
jgi:hypothetical protein